MLERFIGLFCIVGTFFVCGWGIKTTLDDHEYRDTRTLSVEEQDWIADCTDRLVLDVGLGNAKDTCFHMEYSLFKQGYFK